MTVKIADAHDRVHVLTANYEWTILRGFHAGRGPCYISDIRSRRKPRLQPVADGGKGHTINDPRSGGLFGFGLVACKPPVPITKDTKVDPATFWDWGWEITTRLDAGLSMNFGVCNAGVLVTGPTTVQAACTLRVLGETVCRLNWQYEFGPDDQVTCILTVEPQPAHGLWIKEPKVVANGLYGHRKLTVSNGANGKLGGTIDLTRFVDPRVNTKQIPYPTRCRYLFEADGAPTLLIAHDNGLNTWTAEADDADPMTTQYTPAYCLNKGKLWNRSEVARWGDIDTVGLMIHGWEGGYGAPDCLACFRPWPSKPAVIRLGALIGAGSLKLPDAAPKPSPQPKPAAKPSWTIPGPIVLTYSDPAAANDKPGVSAIARIVRPGVGPVWRCDYQGRTGHIAQIEGEDQYQGALDYMQNVPTGDSRAIIGTLDVDPARMLALGINTYFVELNAQAGWEPYGNLERMLWQGRHDGWPFVYPSFGCYDGIGLKDYADYVPMVWDDAANDWKRATKPQGLGPKENICLYSADGLGDTGSWPFLASL